MTLNKLLQKVQSTGRVVLNAVDDHVNDHIDLAACIMFGYAFNDTYWSLGEWRAPVMLASVVIASAPSYDQGNRDNLVMSVDYSGKGIPRSEIGLSRYDHRVYRNVAAGMGALVFWWPNGTENAVNFGFQLFHKSMGALAWLYAAKENLHMLRTQRTPWLLDSGCIRIMNKMLCYQPIAQKKLGDAT